MSQAEKLGLMVAALPGLAALGALLSTWMSIEQARGELAVAEQRQITDRYNAAVRNLGSDSADVRQGGIHALQRIMQDSTRDQSAVVSVLSAYARRHAPVPASGFVKFDESNPYKTPPDVQAVLNALATRTADYDGGQASVDFGATDLRRVKVLGLDAPKGRAAFDGAIFTDADLRLSYFSSVDLRDTEFSLSNLAGAWFVDVDLSRAVIQEADLTLAHLARVNLTEATLDGSTLHEVEVAPTVNLTKATFAEADLTGASLEGVNLRNAVLVGADLGGAQLAGANLHGARLSSVDQEAVVAELGSSIEENGSLAKADLKGADLTNADLRGVDLTGADLRNADVTGAKLAGVKLDRAKLDGVRGLPPSLRP
ncbi:pentapeptide repeat-containing protein [Streptomyces griseosporeus]|uniref:pentapeptide repeat-containing protein n=1 Tax=Streptomyces griseosporeus TaxID=1910 RepID=UPI0037B376C8